MTKVILEIGSGVALSEWEVELNAIRAQGAGGQNVNKVSTAIHLRFDILRSNLPSQVKERLLAVSDQRIGTDGTIVIKAQRFRTQEKNRQDALDRLKEMILGAMRIQKARKATRPSRASQQRRMNQKSHRGKIKSMRGSVKNSE